MTETPESKGMQQVLDAQSEATSGDAPPPPENIEIFREEQGSPTQSSVHMNASKLAPDELRKDFIRCICRKYDEAIKSKKLIDVEDLEKALTDKELELRSEYDKILEREKSYIKERFDYILLNEQIRTSYMLREAHRERQEKINALQSQLNCKNLAALMYVMCTERRRSKLEKLRIIRDYTEYISVLQDILTEGQELILHLSRGYKTAARVDHEWREKMKKVIQEFQSFIYHYAGGSPETNQYFLDLPKLLTTESPIDDNPNEDPCDNEEENDDGPVVHITKEKEWWEDLDDKQRPFVMYGDMSEFSPNQRREVLHQIKTAKTAPSKWKHYVFNNMFFNAACPNVDTIKDLYLTKMPTPSHWECTNLQIPPEEITTATVKALSKQSLNTGRRLTGQSIDIRGNMGSILKIITSANMTTQQVAAKTELLGARDSMEISSTTKLRERASLKPSEEHSDKAKKKEEVVLNIGKKRISVFEGPLSVEDELTPEPTASKPDEEPEPDESVSVLGSIHNDSLQVIGGHVPEKDHKINYEKVCPMDKCQRMQVDSFIRSLPPYMRANPYTHFEQTYDRYETCTKEQLEMLKQRIDAKKHNDEDSTEGVESPLNEWIHRGVAVQTSDLSMSLPPCTCHVPSPTPVSSKAVFNLQDLLPVKHAMDAIHRECLYDERIEFDRFKLIGHESRVGLEEEQPKTEFKTARYEEIKKILKAHPSLLDIFQANTR